MAFVFCMGTSNIWGNSKENSIGLKDTGCLHSGSILSKDQLQTSGTDIYFLYTFIWYSYTQKYFSMQGIRFYIHKINIFFRIIYGTF